MVGAMKLLALVVAGFTLSGCSSGPGLIDRPASTQTASFSARAVLALSDVDMAGTAYADGKLRPVVGQTDTLTAVIPGSPEGVASSVAVSNSVMAWPGSMDISPDGRFAYIAELRGPAPIDVEEYADGVFAGMPRGRRLTQVAIADPAALRIVRQIDLPAPPTAIHVAPNGRFALVALNSANIPLVAVELDDGAPGRITELPLRLSVATERDADLGAMFVRLAPNGRDLAVNLANTHVQFARLVLDGTGLPAAVETVGNAVPAGKWLTMLRWSSEGRHLIVADVAWGPSQLGAATNGPGQIVAIRFDPGGKHGIASQLKVSLSPEGFEMNRSGDLLAVVNMERTYLPDRLPYSLFARRAAASLSLVGFDPGTGRLTTLDGPLAFAGVLPEDAVFDDDGDMLAVAVFHERGEAPKQGWIEWFVIEQENGRRRLVPTGRRTVLPRGVHDLAVLSEAPR